MVFWGEGVKGWCSGVARLFGSGRGMPSCVSGEIVAADEVGELFRCAEAVGPCRLHSGATAGGVGAREVGFWDVTNGLEARRKACET